MEKQILQTESRNKRKQILRDTCVKAKQFTYPKTFTPEEMTLKKDELSQHDIKLEILEKEKKQTVEGMNKGIKEVKTERSYTLNCVRTGMEEVTEQVYLLDDQESGNMGFYNQDGELVYTRLLLKEERQLRMNNLRTVNS